MVFVFVAEGRWQRREKREERREHRAQSTEMKIQIPE
jgi:hypothetical protein